MPAPTIHAATSFEDSGVILMARVVDQNGSNVTQSDITSVHMSVYETPANTEVSSNNNTLTVSNVVFNTLQNPTIWTTDTTGYNFRYDVPAVELPDGDKTYRFEFRFLPSTGAEAFHFVCSVTTVDLVRS